MITPSPEQDRALVAVRDWLSAREKPFFYLAGYAGTGKTSLAKHFADTSDGATLFCAYTGKAALQLRRKGCLGASTIHSRFYQPLSSHLIGELRQEIIDRGPGADVSDLEAEIAALEKERDADQPRFFFRSENAAGAALIVIDESSMVPTWMARDLLTLHVPILVLGDPAQLPPVDAESGFFTAREPDYLLTEVHRHALDSWVLKLATELRERRLPKNGSYGSGEVVIASARAPQGAVVDQIIVPDKVTRRQQICKLRGSYNLAPIIGDKLVCRSNKNDFHPPLLNGMMFEVLNVLSLTKLELKPLDTLAEPFTTFVQKEPLYELEPKSNYYDAPPAFEHAAAITAHVAQGSEWPSIRVFDLMPGVRHWSFTRNWSKERLADFVWAWRYTAVTRASERCELLLRFDR